MSEDQKKTWEDFDEIPPLTREQIMSARPVAERLRARGGKTGERTKDTISFRIDHDLLEWLRESGPGYQTRLNKILREIMEFSKRGNTA